MTAAEREREDNIKMAYRELHYGYMNWVQPAQGFNTIMSLSDF